MLKKSKVVLLKAITMGALLTNGGIGTEGENDKQKKDLNFPLHNAMVHGAATEATLATGGSADGDFHRSLIEPHVKNILLRVDERAEMRRELLRKPIKVDLRGEPIRGILPFHKVLNTLLADAQKYDVSLNLTLLNATEAELSELLNHPNSQFIKELDWDYKAPLIDDMDAYDWLEDEKIGKDEEWVDETVGFTLTPDDVDEEWIDDPVGFTPTSGDSDEEWIDDPVGFTPTSGDSDEEGIDDPVGFTPTSDDSDEEWIDDPVGFTPDDSDEEWIDDPIRVIRDDEADEEWVYDLLGFMRDDPVEELIYDPLGLMRDGLDEERAEDPLVLMRDGLGEEHADDPIRVIRDDEADEEWVYDLLGFMRDDPVEELIYDPLGLMRDGLDEERAEDPLVLMRDGLGEEHADDPVGEAGAEPYVPRLKKIVARARYMPLLHDLVDDFGQEEIITLDKEVVADKGNLANENHNPQLSGWSMTLINNAEKNSDSNAQDLDQFKKLTHRASHNLVQIFCRGG